MWPFVFSLETNLANSLVTDKEWEQAAREIAPEYTYAVKVEDTSSDAQAQGDPYG